MRTPPYVLVPVYFRSSLSVVPHTVLAPFGFLHVAPVLLIPAADTQALTETLARVVAFGNPVAPRATWTTVSATATALSLKTERQFEKGTRLFHLCVFPDRVEVSELPKANGRGFGGSAISSRSIPRTQGFTEIVHDLGTRIEDAP